jgi:hypothetical protein
MYTVIHASSEIWTHDPSVRVDEDGSCVRPRGHCDRIRLTNLGANEFISCTVLYTWVPEESFISADVRCTQLKRTVDSEWWCMRDLATGAIDWLILLSDWIFMVTYERTSRRQWATSRQCPERRVTEWEGRYETAVTMSPLKCKVKVKDDVSTAEVTERWMRRERRYWLLSRTA